MGNARYVTGQIPGSNETPTVRWEGNCFEKKSWSLILSRHCLPSLKAGRNIGAIRRPQVGKIPLYFELEGRGFLQQHRTR
jgi:hypothetical protein